MRECVLCLNMEGRGPTHLLYVVDSEATFVDLLGLEGMSKNRLVCKVSVRNFFLNNHFFGMQNVFSQRNSHKW